MKSLMNVMVINCATSCSGLEALKCSSTSSLEWLGCRNYNEFLNCKNDLVKYNLCSSCHCEIGVDTLLFQQERVSV